jgi:hypothetical protein
MDEQCKMVAEGASSFFTRFISAAFSPLLRVFLHSLGARCWISLHRVVQAISEDIQREGQTRIQDSARYIYIFSRQEANCFRSLQ